MSLFPATRKMPSKSIKASQKQNPLSETLRHFDRSSYKHRATSLLCCALFLVTAGAPAAPGPADNTVHQSPPASYDIQGANDELDDDDDGSARLDDRSRRIGEHMLLPITVGEEQQLLGDWGDSENED